MATITKWNPILNLPPKFDLETLTYDSEGLAIILKYKTQIETLLRIHFRPFFGFRLFAEPYRLKMLFENPILTSAEMNWTFFFSDDDDFLHWLKSENLTVLDDVKGLRNYIIATPDDIIEVVSNIPPTVEWI